MVSKTLKHPKKLQGFTLIELVVTIAISLFITGGIIVNYNSYNSTQNLKQTALTLKNDLRFMQSKARNGEKPAGVACGTLSGWTVSIYLSSYTYEANCDDAPVGDPVTVTLPFDITFTSIPSPNTITFKVLTRGTDLAAPVDVVLFGFGRHYTLQINPSGDISDQGLQ
jgi:prepilin-type N-terminal cleavage/methylation domain-containing protein